MTDRRFFRACGPFALNYIAFHIGAEEPSPSTSNIWIHGVGDVETAGSGDLSVFFDIRYATALAGTKAVPWSRHASWRCMRWTASRSCS